MGADQPEFVRLMNLGKAQLENRNSAGARAAFEKAVALEPGSPPAWRNLARAFLLANQPEPSLQALERARALKKESAATSYLLGLTQARNSKFELAIPYFEEAVRLDPDTPALRFQLANAYQLTRRTDQALIQWRETVRLDPLHASAQFKLAMLARQSGDQAEYERRQQEFMRLRTLFGDQGRTPTALERCLYTRPEPGTLEPEPISPSIPVVFRDQTRQRLPQEATDHVAAVSVIEIEENGRTSLLLVSTNGSTAWLLAGSEKPFLHVAGSLASASGSARSVTECVTGNFKDEVPAGEKYDPTVHARNDLVCLGPDGVRLWERTGPTNLTDVTAQAGLAGVKSRRAVWLDYDHDGDLDLALATAGGLQLWQNNGDGRFTNVTEAVGITETGACVDLAAVDLDGNGAIDLVAARGAKPTLVFLNQRTGHFLLQSEPPGPWPPANRVLSNDLNNDGVADVLLFQPERAVLIAGKKADRKEIPFPGLSVDAAALLDFDNDGWLDLCLAGHGLDQPDRGLVELWRNQGNGSWSNVSGAANLDALDLPRPAKLLAVDLDDDGDTDLLLLTRTGQLKYISNEGGQANGQLKLRLVGTKTNPAGIGTRLEVRAGNYWITRAVGALPIELGLGGHRQLDSVKTIWTNGIEDNEIGLDRPTNVLTIVEKNVAAGSCPYLFAWDGQRFRFATDLLGNSPLGLSLRRGVVLPSDPEEIVRIGGAGDFQPRQGYYELEITEELREVLYLDQARLLAVDHPVDVEVHSNDKLGPPPFPPSVLRPIRVLRLPVRAEGDDGLDRTEALQAIDGRFAPPGPILPPPLRGMCHPLVLTLDFGPWDGLMEKPLVLALTGWLQYGDASANVAASQNASLPVVPPKLEAQGNDGAWTLVDSAVGLPAGKTKTILCDLAGKLPPETRRLRLTTTFEVRWDRIALGETVPGAVIRQFALDPAEARLDWRGFSEIRARVPGHPPRPDYNRVSTRPPWRTTPQGWCTRYGDVLELLTRRDGQLVLMNGGDGLRLRFQAADLPPVPTASGRTRTYFFYSVGWDKDADYNVVEGDTVEPLPVPEVADWVTKYNTRWVPRDRY
jgi:Tfp pilus assembly protein PilF